MVEAHAAADAGERVARKIEVRNGRHEKSGLLAHQPREPRRMVPEDLLIGNARHRLAHKLFRVFDGQKILRQRLSVPPRAAARFLDHIGNKRLTERRLLFKDLSYEAI